MPFNMAARSAVGDKRKIIIDAFFASKNLNLNS
jgi:hypothetical protein